MIKLLWLGVYLVGCSIIYKLLDKFWFSAVRQLPDMTSGQMIWACVLPLIILTAIWAVVFGCIVADNK